MMVPMYQVLQVLFEIFLVHLNDYQSNYRANCFSSIFRLQKTGNIIRQVYLAWELAVQSP